MTGFPPAVTAPIALGLLVAEIAIAGSLVAGTFVVRSRHVRAHAWMQASMVLVNIPIVLTLMVPPYLQYFWPSLPGTIGQPAVLYSTIMLGLGVVAESLGVYIVLVAGTNLIPDRWRFRRYKLWMRTELVLWWAVLLAGIATYYTLWVPGG
jgi:uncharacterized membrane protein YozB (DUF420 family)